MLQLARIIHQRTEELTAAATVAAATHGEIVMFENGLKLKKYETGNMATQIILGTQIFVLPSGLTFICGVPFWSKMSIHFMTYNLTV